MPANLKVVFEIVTKGVENLGQAQGKINAFGASVGKQIKSFANLKNAIIGGIGYAVISKEISTAVKAYAEQEEATARLTNALGYESQALLELANERQKVTKFGDDQTVMATAILADYIKEEDKLRELIPVVQDFATAKRMDLASASDLVVKTLQTENNALKRHGVDVQGAAGSTERFRSAVDGLNAAFRGNAEAVGATATGQLAIFNNQVGELRESLGKALMPALLDITQILQNDFVPIFEDAIRLYDKWNHLGEKDVDTQQQLSLALIEKKNLWEKIRKEQMEIQAAGPGSEEWGLFDPKMLAQADTVLARISAKLTGIQDKKNEKPKQRASVISTGGSGKKSGGGKTGGYDSGVFDFMDSVQISESDVVAIEDMITKTMVDAETKRNEYLRQIRVMGTSELSESLKEQAALYLQDRTDGLVSAADYEQIKTDNMRQQAEERKRIAAAEMQHSLWVGDQVLGAIESAAQAEFQIEKNKREQMKPILRSMAIMRFAAATASGVAKAWETSKTWYEGLALSFATVVQNGAMLAGQLTSINSAATGADFIANKPQLLLVGDNPTRREHVSVTPMGSPNLYGPGGSRNGGGGGGSNTYHNRIIINDQVTGARLQRALRNGEMPGFVSDMKRAMATA